MIVWITSYSRSGNTFFRIVLTHLFQVDTTAAFDAGETLLSVDGAASFVKHKKLPEHLANALRNGTGDTAVQQALQEMEDSNEIYFIKPHAPPESLYGVCNRAVLIVRDPRDCLTSFAHFNIDVSGSFRQLAMDFRDAKGLEKFNPNFAIRFFRATVYALARHSKNLKSYLVNKQIDRLLDSDSTYYNWGAMNRAWASANPKPVVVRFDELVADPIAAVRASVDKLGLSLKADSKELPSFKSLQSTYPQFFRSGQSGDWKNWMSAPHEARVRKLYGDLMANFGLM